MPRLIAAIIRHGDYRQLPDTPSAHQPFALSSQGQQQALEAADLLRKMVLQQDLQLHCELDCSHLLRAWQTADIIRQQLHDLCADAPFLRETDALAERSVGIAGNLTVAQIESVLSNDPRYSSPPADWKSNSHYLLPLPGAESLLQAGERVATHMATTMQQLSQHVSQDTLKIFVGHGAAFRHAAHHLGILPFDQIAALSMYHADPVYFEYWPPQLGQAQKWQHIAGQWKIRQQGSDYRD